MKKLLFVASLLLGLASCEFLSPSVPDDITGIYVKSTNVHVGYTTATVYGEIGFSGNSNRITEVNVAYGTSEDNLTQNVKASFEPTTGFSAELSGLEDGVLYYYTVRIIVGKTPVNGDVDSFITFAKGPVDLDLPSGIKWASHNVGAEIPTDFGGAYAWGEVEEKEQYDWSSYLYCLGSNFKLTKYVTNSVNGTVDNLNLLEEKDDVARQKLGKDWRMPTYKEMMELIENCVITRVKINDVKGFTFTSKKDQKSLKKRLFLPETVTYDESRTFYLGHYWSASLNTTTCQNAMGIYFYGDNVGSYHALPRRAGTSVRAVYAK